jgi:hypothetical protein
MNEDNDMRVVWSTIDSPTNAEPIKHRVVDDNATIDDALRELIEDSDLEEVVCCLDMICNEQNKHIMMFNGTGVEYPSVKHLFRQK